MPNSSTNVEISLKNTGDTAISWIRAPMEFSPLINSVEVAIQDSGWIMAESGKYISGDVNPGETIIFSTYINTGNDEGTADWNWETSVNFFGDPIDNCNSINFLVTSAAPTSAPTPTPIPAPAIRSTNLAVGNNFATLTWNTDMVATGTVYFGTTNNYGMTVNTVSGTSHTANLSNLLPSTVYHYQILVSGEGGNTMTNDETFTTSAASVNTITTSTVTVNTTTTTTNLVTKILKDTAPPTITIKTDFDKNFETAPTITGKVIDGGEVNQGVASIDYSIDGGKNWTPVDEISDMGKKITNFEFTPPKLDDGNYSIKVRAKDVSGNTGLSKTVTMVIDRLPPQVGSVLFYSGPMILSPDTMGNIKVIEGTEVKTVMSAVGGPIKIDLLVDEEKFSLIKNEESGLWSGTIKISKTGILKLKIRSVDGANNETEKKLNTILSVDSGKIIDESDKPIVGGKIKIYAFEKTLNDFVWWNAEPYLQKKSIETDSEGKYRLYLPAGKYFLEIESKGKRKIRSEIFETKDNVLINQNFKVNNFSLWSWWPETIKINLLDKTEEKTKNPFGD